ncbi:hypothetical protein SCLCIDRAFT_1050749 [Scleroderma citrinum Foug A]|uniref:Uncharacterized protein n=1 Tax=Scleroderma citrinum Foug A TaxID=1036808 RepID=A0A0C2ZAJ4_9AGAM|nr:hypothetical protein SCLCIDRAFT_1050749 [Scleroderma citrinum Foug A]
MCIARFMLAAAGLPQVGQVSHLAPSTFVVPHAVDCSPIVNLRSEPTTMMTVDYGSLRARVKRMHVSLRDDSELNAIDDILHSFREPVVLKSVHGIGVLSDELLENSTDSGTTYLCF